MISGFCSKCKKAFDREVITSKNANTVFVTRFCTCGHFWRGKRKRTPEDK